MQSLKLHGRKLLAVALMATLVTTFIAANAAQAQDAKVKSLGLDGYCPVCLIKAKQWVRGKPDHQVTYDGKTYYFPSENEKRMFKADPAKYVPAFGGDCTVCYAKAGKRVSGNIRHGAHYKGRVFLFTSAGTCPPVLKRSSVAPRNVLPAQLGSNAQHTLDRTTCSRRSSRFSPLHPTAHAG